MGALIITLLVLVGGVLVIRLLPLAHKESEQARFWRSMR